MIKSIVRQVGTTESVLNLKDIADNHFDAVHEYGNTNGWPLQVALVKKKNKYVLAHVDDESNSEIISKGIMHKDAEKEDLVKALSSEINFLV